ncbi:hypothetical protein KDW36_04300 [Burkholderia dolosa]|uniref:hypothetical protein n=1 Tax=Burkholderia dolosa TaxID=152500 RepID=UPI001B9DFEE1|nr:hypothetical protein [Burkholderia dolosa]MBR8312418.1 hypothetical protein [Burkholderia dolosa]
MSNDYRVAFKAACADLGAISALLGFEEFPGVDALLRSITELIAGHKSEPSANEKSGTRLERSIEQWCRCDPDLMSKQSQAAIFYALKDAKHDILALAGAHPGQPEPRECRHCGWMCIPNSTPSTTHYPLPQPEPSGEVTAFTTTVGRMLATAPHFEECETPEPCLSALIHRYYENYFDREKGREHAELYIAALYEAARAQGGES